MLTENDSQSKLVETIRVPRPRGEEDSDDDQHERWQERSGKARDRMKYQESDTLSVLVGLYGSQEAFLSEYQHLLAEKLLGAREFNLEEETKNVELLKLRFGEFSLQTCKVILRDIKDSRRIDKQVYSMAPKLEVLSVLSVSKGYWPINYQARETQIPHSLQPMFEEYGRLFRKVKPVRRMAWHFELGSVDIELTFANGAFPFRCLPIHAVLIAALDERVNPLGLSSEALGKELGLPVSYIKQKMSFWVYKGVVRESKATSQPHYSLALRRQLSSTEVDSEMVHYSVVGHYEEAADSQDYFLEIDR
jgi:anaphase-promoting complex subunit 2